MNIWSSDTDNFNFEEIRAEILEWRNEARPEGHKLLLEDITDEKVWAEICFLIETYRDDEKGNMDKDLKNKVIAISDYFWHDSEYKILGYNLNSVFEALGNTDNQSIYCDKNNLRGKDGCEHFVFRMIAPGVDAEELIEKIEDGRISEKTLYKKYTRSLRPYIREIYGC